MDKFLKVQVRKIRFTLGKNWVNNKFARIWAEVVAVNIFKVIWIWVIIRVTISLLNKKRIIWIKQNISS